MRKQNSFGVVEDIFMLASVVTDGSIELKLACAD